MNKTVAIFVCFNGTENHSESCYHDVCCFKTGF